MIPYILVHQDPEKRRQEAEKIISQEGFSKNHPDLLWLEEEKLGIESARKIQQFLSLKPYQGKGQAIVILIGENLTPEAQNALLKTLDEPSLGTVFILGTASDDQLLPTILSRCQIINLQSPKGEDDPETEKKFFKDIEKLLASDYEQRFQYIEKLEEREEFLKVLTHYFHGRLIKEGEFKKTKDYLHDLMEAQKWANQYVNIRAILEYLMLKMPIKSDK
jgi:hypothetical protein